MRYHPRIKNGNVDSGASSSFQHVHAHKSYKESNANAIRSYRRRMSMDIGSQVKADLSHGELRQHRVRIWTRLLFDYALWNSLIQAAGIVAGLLFVNLMPLREYAFYTLASSGATFLTILCDLGVTNSLFYFRRKAEVSAVSFEAYVQGGERLRRLILGLGTPVFLSVFLFFALRNGFGATESVTAALLVVGGTWYQISAAIRTLSMKIEGRYRESYVVEAVAAGTRLAIACLLAVASAMYGLLGVAGNALAFRLAALAGRHGRRRAVFGAPQMRSVAERRSIRRELIGYIIPTLPNAIYFAFQGVIVTGLSAVFGNTQNIAEVGALGRLGVIVGLLGGLVPALIIPRLTRVGDERLYKVRYVQYGAVLIVAGLVILATATAWPWLFLMLLGRQYAALSSEVAIVIAGAVVSLIGSYCGGVNQARGWVRLQPAALGVFVSAQALLIWGLPLSTTGDVFLFSLISASVGSLLQFTLNVIGFSRPEWVAIRDL